MILDNGRRTSLCGSNYTDVLEPGGTYDGTCRGAREQEAVNMTSGLREGYHSNIQENSNLEYTGRNISRTIKLIPAVLVAIESSDVQQQ